MSDGCYKIPSTEELESLFVNNEAVARIETHLNRFNPIRVMKMERMEIRHSAILSWLLNPSESHGLGDIFLKAFLAEALRGHRSNGPPTALDVARADLRDAIVRTEWQHIDIFVHSERNGWAFVIENKYDSKQHEGQLAKYLESAATGLGQQADDWAIQGIFLTLHGEEPDDPRYASITYDVVCQFLPKFIGQESHLLTAEVRTFLQHYVDVIAEEIGMSAEHDEMEKLARQLYRDNKKALDFIMEYGAGSDFSIAAERHFGPDSTYPDLIEIDDAKYRFFAMDHRSVSFIPDDWYVALGEDRYSWRGCEKWWPEFPIASWIQLWSDAEGKSGQLGLYGEVGPLSEYEFRRGLIEAIQSAAEEAPKSKIKFQKAAAEEGKKYSKFFKENFLRINDVQDVEEISQGIRKLLEKFQPEFDAIGRVLPDFVKYGYVDQ